MALKKNQYETVLTITEFKGLYQGAEMNTGMSYAKHGANFDTTGGGLKSMSDGCLHVPAALDAPIATLMLLYRRFLDEKSVFPDSNAIFIAVSGGKIYARPIDRAASERAQWRQLDGGASGGQTIPIAVTNGVFDYVTYQVSEYYVKDGHRVSPKTAGCAAVEAANPIDVLIMTNADDGMYIVYGDTLDIVPFEVRPAGAAQAMKFGIITRHAERIWGGGIPGDPDKLMFSATLNPLDWEQNADYPEDGAGDIQQPSWDGDSFVALRTYGSYLLALKRNRIWRVSGTNPGEYYWKEQFGGGTIVENTVVVYNDYMYLLSYDGIMVYDGTSVQRYRQQYVRDFIDGINWAYVHRAVAAMRGAVYCLAVPTGESKINNAILEYNTQERSFNIREGVYVDSFLQYEDELYFTDGRASSSGASGAVYHFRGGTKMLPMEYITAYQDLGYKGVTKSGFELYLTADTQIPVTAAIRTEKKYKEKTVWLEANKAKRMRLNATGRMFRLELRVPESDVPWKLLGTVEIDLETDWD